MKPMLPDIANFMDYRTFLRNRYQVFHANNRRFSQRMIALKVGAHSAGWFSDILAGRQKLKVQHLPKIASVFKLDLRETEFLDTWVRLERSATAEEKAVLSEKWLLLRGLNKEAVEADRFAYFKQWYHLALREMMALHPGTDPVSLSDFLTPPISKSKAKKASLLIQRLGLIPPPNSQYREPPILVKAPGSDTGVWNHILRQLHNLAGQAMLRYSKDERDISALTLSLSPTGLRKAKEEVTNLRKRLLIIANKDCDNRRVYQCLFQLFPLSLSKES